MSFPRLSEITTPARTKSILQVVKTCFMGILLQPKVASAVEATFGWITFGG